MRNQNTDKYAILYATVITFQIGLGGLLTGAYTLLHHTGFVADPRQEAKIALMLASIATGLGIALFILITRSPDIRNINFPKSVGEAIGLTGYFTVLVAVWFPVMISVFGGGFGLPVLFLVNAAFDIIDESAVMPVKIVVLIIAVPGIIAGLSALNRISWLIGMRQNLQNLPASKIRSAATGLVELRGKAVRALPPEENIKNIFYRERTEKFFIQDDTGRMLVAPPGTLLAYDARYSLPIHYESLLPVLDEGEQIYVLGFLDENPEAPKDATGPDRLFVRPWKTPFGQAYGKFLGLFGKKVYELFRFFDTPDLFLLGRGAESIVDSRIFRSQRIWIGFSLMVLAGSAFLFGLSLDALLNAPLW